MSITLNAVTVRSSTRVRLVFSGALAGGAFSAGLWTIWDNTINVPGPSVAAALAVAGLTNQVELVLASPLTSDDSIIVTGTNVPAADLSTFTGQAATYWGPNVLFTPNVEPQQNNGDDLVFGRDLVHNGVDYIEDATSDLAGQSGLQNVQSALYRRILAYGLPWDQSFGPRLDDFVDGPNAQAAPASGLIKRQMLADDRVTACKVTLQEDDTAAGGASFQVDVTLRTDRKLPPFDIAVGELLSTGE